jgi:glycosyltransferase involved in cell wall biosynthesis
LAVDAPGIRDAVVNGVTGVLVRPQNESELSEVFAKAMVDFVHDDCGRHSLGASARRRALEFSWDGFVDQWEALLSEVALSGSGQVH